MQAVGTHLRAAAAVTVAELQTVDQLRTSCERFTCILLPELIVNNDTALHMARRFRLLRFLRIPPTHQLTLGADVQLEWPEVSAIRYTQTGLGEEAWESDVLRAAVSANDLITFASRAQQGVDKLQHRSSGPRLEQIARTAAQAEEVLKRRRLAAAEEAYLHDMFAGEDEGEGDEAEHQDEDAEVIELE